MSTLLEKNTTGKEKEEKKRLLFRESLRAMWLWRDVRVSGECKWR